MKRKIVGMIAAVLLFTGIAIAGSGNTMGEITKIKGAMVTIKTSDGEKTVHVDPAGTKKEGEIKVGAMVSADVTSKGHANWIKVMEHKK